MLVFTRIGGMVMLMPGFGEVSVPPWIRLGMAFAITMVMFPLVSDVLPAMPDSPVGYAAAVTTEALVGLFIGGIARLLLTALHVGGLAIAMQTGLGFAQGFDPTQQSQSAMVGTFLTLVGVNLILATNLHHLMIGAMHDSYQIFMPGDLPPVVREQEFRAERLDVHQAIMQMNLLHKSFLVFTNKETDHINVVYRMDEGYGLVETRGHVDDE